MFDLGKLSNNLSKLSKGLLGNTMFLLSTKAAQNRSFNTSIWGCGVFNQGFYGGYPPAPPLDIFHPYYSNQGINPYLVDQGLQSSENRLRSRFQEIYNNNLQRERDFVQNRHDTTADATAGKNATEALINNNGFGFVTDAWKELNAKQESLDGTQKEELTTNYQKSLFGIAKAMFSNFDTDKNNNVSLSEVQEKLLELKGDDISEEERTALLNKAEIAYNKIKADGSENIVFEDIVALIAHMDKDRNGEIEDETIVSTKAELTNTSSNIQEEIENQRNLFHTAE